MAISSKADFGTTRRSALGVSVAVVTLIAERPRTDPYYAY
jgi:hypothetical protein